MHRLPVIEASQVAEVRRLATRLAHELGFNETEAGTVALVATEAASNLVKHATGGQLLMRQLENAAGVELLALDTCPGMRNVGECLRDGYSSAGSPGTGLGAIARLATCWDIYSVVGVGTALLMRVSPAAAPPSPASPLGVGIVSLPKSDEEVCGDAWAVVQQAGRCLVMVADGLGHGPEAARAAQGAVRVVRAHPLFPPTALLERMHGALQKTRGAAVAVAEIDLRRQAVTFAGVGNIAGTLVMAEDTQHLMSYSGIVGHQMRKVQALTYPWSDEALLVLHSDGLATRWDLKSYAGLARRHPSLIAGVLYRDFARGRDDVTVVVVRASSKASQTDSDPAHLLSG